MKTQLTHADAEGRVSMVDISEKSTSTREAIAGAKLLATPETVAAIFQGSLKKGEALAAARIAGIMAAKKTADLIPLCHPISLTDVQVEFERADDHIAIRATAKCVGATGVEMEAMTAATVAALTLYDMAKGIERSMTVQDIWLIKKSGGKSGTYLRTR